MQGPLVVLAHPDLASSRVNAALAQAARATGRIQVHDLFAAAPDGRFDGEAERARLLAHDRIVLQFPLTWYCCPPLLSAWRIEVMRRGWAYGPGGRALRLKTFGIAVTTGSNGRDYTPEGRYGRSLDDVAIPFEMLATHTSMHWLAPFAVTGVRELSDAGLASAAQHYCDHLLKSRPRILASGRDDDRARTVYPDG